MLSAQENEFVTRTGPGTPMGELMRRLIFGWVWGRTKLSLGSRYCIEPAL